MTDQFTVSTKDRAVLQKFYKDAPAAMTRISAGVLTSMARADREQIPKTMDNLLTVRTPSVIKKATRFVPANKSQPINQQQSISGSIEIPRHDAWAHIQQGAATRITQFTDEGRGGSSRGVARKQAKAGKHTDESDLNIKGSGSKRTQAFLFAIKRDSSKRRKPFYLSKPFKGMPRGVYRYIGGRVRKGMLMAARLARLSTPKADVDPKMINWKEQATKTAITETKLKRWWVDQQQRELNKIKPR